MVRHISCKLKNIFTDTMWSIAGLTLMNVAAQFVVYPYWNRALGTESYGNIVYLIAIMNVMAISVGNGINYTRMRQSANGQTANKPYNLLMIGGSIISLFVLLLLKAAGALILESSNFILFCILTVVTMWRYYADVEYRLNINYKGYFQYYLFIGFGYLLGFFIFKFSGRWILSLLPGEIAGLLFVLCRGSIFKKDINIQESLSPQILRLALMLIGTNVLAYLIFNGDKIILQVFAGSTTVTIYYIASLFGKTMTLITTPLNGVLVGHLAKYEGNLTRKLMNQVTIISIGAVVTATFICVAVSWITLPFLYPKDYQELKQYLILANAAQVIYFVGNVLVASVLLRFTHARNQLIVNVVHGILFISVCIPVALRFGISGFCWGLLVVNLIRYLLCVMIGYLNGR